MTRSSRILDRPKIRGGWRPIERARLVLCLGLAWSVACGGVASGQAWDGAAPTGVGASASYSDLVAGSGESSSIPRLQWPWNEAIGESLFGRLRPDLWRPLGLGNLFTEGWDEQYAPAPDIGADGAPRQTWIGSADGAFYRLFVFSFGYARGVTGTANAYNGSYYLFTPLSRRFELGWFLPFVNSSPNTLNPGPGGDRYWTDAGDLTIAPRVLLVDDRRYSVTSDLFVRLPIGSIRNGNGVASLSPDLEFWANPGKRRVFRGALGVTIPTNETRDRLPILALAPFNGFNASPTSMTSFDARLAYGRYLTPSDARIFPDFIYSVATNLHTALSGGHSTYFSVTPGFRFGVGNNWYFLGGLEVPLVGPLAFQTQTTFQIIKNF